MSLYGLDLESYERTRRAVRWAEGQYGGAPVAHDSAGVIEADSEVWFQTDSVAPGGYSGSAWFPGTIKRVKPSGSTVTVGPGLIKDLNAKALTPSTIYRGLFAQMVLDGGALKPAFFVTGFVDGVSASGGLTMAHYNAGTVSLSGGVYYTTVTLYAGGTLTIKGAPWGKDAVVSRQFFNYGELAFSHWPVLLRDTDINTENYFPIPFHVAADVRYFSSATNGQIVECRARSLTGFPAGPWVCKAWDFLGLIPLSGIYRAMLTLRPTVHPTVGPMGFAVVSVNTAAPVAASSGVSLSGSAFPSGMGGAFPGSGTPSTAVDPVE